MSKQSRPGETFVRIKMMTKTEQPRWFNLIPTRSCLICSIPLPEEFLSKGNSKYCLSCSARRTKNGSHIRGRGYARYLVRARDRFTCQDCGVQRTPQEVEEYNANLEGLKGRLKSLDVHHLHGMCGKKSRGHYKVEDMATLITLCHSCHFRRHDFSQRLAG